MSVKGVGLISGGLDSMLAAKMLQNQGIEVIGVSFQTGFTTDQKWRQIKAASQNESVDINDFASAVSDKLGFRMVVKDISEAYWNMFKEPTYGYGRFINPCIDCRIMMLRTAKAVMEEEGADFVFTGEVISQRPMTQFRKTMKQTEADAGLEGRLLRPLSAQLLEPTIPELEGKVKRELLESITGRSRKRQLELAKEWNLTEVAPPGGGNCQLISPDYAHRMKDLFKYKGKENVTRDDARLMGAARHIRLNDTCKIIISRDKSEHLWLHTFTDRYDWMELIDTIGSMALIDGTLDKGDKLLAAKILSRYSKAGDEEVNVRFYLSGSVEELKVVPLKPDDDLLQELLI